MRAQWEAELMEQAPSCLEDISIANREWGPFVSWAACLGGWRGKVTVGCRRRHLEARYEKGVRKTDGFTYLPSNWPGRTLV